MPEKRLAILIPAWQEADVIARMVDHTVEELDYRAYDIFIGVYPNDADTIREADAWSRATSMSTAPMSVIPARHRRPIA